MSGPDAVTDAGPLIYLAVLGRFSLLRDIFGRIYLPMAVYEEVVVRGAGLPGAYETRQAVEMGWLQRAQVRNRIPVDALLSELDIGEAEAIVLARELGVKRILVDDSAARTRARLMGLSVTGTIGVLLLARQGGVGVDLKQDLDVLIQHSFHISRRLYELLVSK